MEAIRNKIIWLIGGSGTIGRKTAKLLSSAGATVLLTGRNPQKLQDAAAAAQIPSSQQYVLDLEVSSEVEQTISLMLADHGTPDIVINAAGIGIIKPIELLSLEEFNRSIQVNLTASFLFMKYVIPAMKQTGKGLIIHIPGVLGKTPMAGAVRSELAGSMSRRPSAVALACNSAAAKKCARAEVKSPAVLRAWPEARRASR
jgi:NAD(P)-dependent dehydrogenase (short-subunit alcohol dehydrogenase family)